MIKVFKIVHGLEGVPFDDLFTFHDTITRGNGYKLFKQMQMHKNTLITYIYIVANCMAESLVRNKDDEFSHFEYMAKQSFAN